MKTIKLKPMSIGWSRLYWSYTRMSAFGFMASYAVACDDISREYFDIPEGTDEAWVTFSDRPSASAYKFEHNRERGVVRIVIGKKKFRWERACDEFVKLIGLHGSYVSVEYKDPT